MANDRSSSEHVHMYIENEPFVVCYLKKIKYPFVNHGYLLQIFYVLIIYSTKSDNFLKGGSVTMEEMKFVLRILRRTLGRVNEKAS